MPSRFHRIFILALLSLFVTLPILAQTDRGTILGTITDSTGAVVASVEVDAINTGTGIEYRAQSNNLGFYSLLNLPIGAYSLNFSKNGFKRLDRSGVVVETQHTQQVNAKLLVGQASETVQVNGSPVLELQTEVGTNITSQAMTDLPLTAQGGRDLQAFAFALTPNVNGNPWTSSIAGSQAFSKSVLIDGTSTDSGIVGEFTESEPSMDAVQEAQVDTAGLRAEDGRSGGGAILFELKSGTDNFHGAAFGLLANAFLNANTWDNNYFLSQCGGDPECIHQYKRAQNNYYDYGFSGGGPIWKSRKMYLFTAYEKYMQSDSVELPNQATAPTAKMLSGDFSELLPSAAAANGCLSSPCQLTNSAGSPATDAAGNPIYYGSIFSPNGLVYPGNIITDPISPIATKIASLYKGYTAQTDNVINNYPALANNIPWFHQTQLSFKYDWTPREADHIGVSYIYTLRPRNCTSQSCGSSSANVLWLPGSQAGGPLANASQQTTITNQYRFNETHTFSPNMLNVLAYTFNSFANKSIPATALSGSTNYPNEIGFGGLGAGSQFPLINFSGNPNGVQETSIGTNVPHGGYVAYNAILNESLAWTKGRQTLKFGGEYRALGFNHDTYAGPLAIAFSNNTFAPTDTAIQQYVGSAFANFLLGQVQSASQGTDFIQDARRKEISFFIQDDIKVNPRLTISADLRWELTRPLHTLAGNWSNFDPHVGSPAYGGIPGAFTYLSSKDGSFETYTDWHQLAPKIGAAYQATSKIVVRGSFGINFTPLGWNGYNATPYGSAVGFTGVNQVLEVAAQTPAYQWDGNPYPGVYTPPTGPDPTSQLIPWGPAYVDPHTRQLGFTENWFAGVQYALPGNSKIEVSYIGNSGRNLHDGLLPPYNYPTWNTYRSLLATGNVYNWVQDSSSAAAAGVPYPYPGFAGPAYFAINPFPNVQANYANGIFYTNSPIGQSGYNGFTVEGVKQRGSLNLNLSYNWSRTTGNTGSAFIDNYGGGPGFGPNAQGNGDYWQDPYKYKYEAHWPIIQDTIKGFASYALPFGKGRRFLSNGRLLDYALGGWVATTIVAYGNGQQMGAVGSTNNYPGWSAVYTNVTPGANFKNHFKKWNPNWNPSKGGDPGSLFVDPANFSNPAFGQLGNSPTLFSNWRSWAAPSENASLLKKTRFGSDGRYVVTLRAEFFDLFNRHYWNGPNTNFASPYFGHVTGVSGSRTGQVGARFEW